MNKNSLWSEFRKTLFRISVFSVLTILFLFVFPSKGTALAPFIFLLSQVFLLFLVLNIADIEITNNFEQITFLYLFKTKSIMSSTVELYDIVIDRGDSFLLETNIGRIDVHYTKINYNILLDYLVVKNYPNIESFKKKVRMEFSQPR